MAKRARSKSRAHRASGVPPGHEVLGTAIEERALIVAGILAFLGILIAAYLTYEHWQIASGGATSCSVNAFFDCDPVLRSPYAYLLGVPLAIVGLGGFIAIEALVLWRFLFMERGATMSVPLLLGGLCVGGVALGGYLTYLELFVIDAICPFCLSSFIVMVMLSAVLAMTYWSYGMATLASLRR